MTGSGRITTPPLAKDSVAALHRLDLGRFDVGPGRRLIPITGFLLTTCAGRHLLFDTGFPTAYAGDERAAALADGLDRFGRLVGFTPAQTIEGALARHRLTPGDIDLVLLSHGHIDHVGGLPLFAGAEIVLTARERAEPRPLYFGSARPIEWPAARYRRIDRPTWICRGLLAIPTPGHTPGHMSALVRAPRGWVVLAQDAINRLSEPAEGYPDAMDPVSARRSGSRLLRLARRRKALLICGHEPAEMPTAPGAAG
jgi:N-acyl homoserine lactone hydrolase